MALNTNTVNRTNGAIAGWSDAKPVNTAPMRKKLRRSHPSAVGFNSLWEAWGAEIAQISDPFPKHSDQRIVGRLMKSRPQFGSPDRSASYCSRAAVVDCDLEAAGKR
jgi:hypothetical protein